MNSNNAQITNLDLLDYMKENNLPILSKCLVNPLMDYILFSCKLIRSNLEETIILRSQKKIERFICTLHKWIDRLHIRKQNWGNMRFHGCSVNLQFYQIWAQRGNFLVQVLEDQLWNLLSHLKGLRGKNSRY